MARIRGIDIVLINKKKVGTDAFHAPIYEDIEKVVNNVLVAPAASDDIVDSMNLYGKKVVYVLAIPKGDQNTWEGQEVKFFGQKFRVFGKELEGIDHLIPLSWNKKVWVEAYE
ncbi:hypothetical protein [Anaerococcus tetradius]|uniref:hypothetical protein n=1 Tax=Anaerococcus tetradius TaxID=33036 RepID=UPI0023F09BC5|nr:hypothetical protein [Anaerococcus tetradius]